MLIYGWVYVSLFLSTSWSIAPEKGDENAQENPQIHKFLCSLEVLFFFFFIYVKIAVNEQIVRWKHLD